MKRFVLSMGLLAAAVLAAVLAGCETAPEPGSCSGITCSRHGVCIADSSGFHCQCDEGYAASGAECLPESPCSPNPCTAPHQTICTSNGGNANCGCDPGYVVLDGRCIVDDSCEPNPCTGVNRTACRAVGTTAICSCDAGYREDSLGNCVEACNPNPCLNPHQGVCIAAAMGFRCDCDDGYALDFQSGRCRFEPPPDCAMAHADGDSYEPNECPSLANELVAPASVAASIEGADDTDWFAVESTGDRVYLFEATSASSHHYLEVSARRRDGITPFGTSVSSYSSPIARLAVSPAAGRFYVRVKSSGDSPPLTGAYTLSVATITDDFGNSASNSSSLSTAQPLAGEIDYPFDEDWFVVSAVAQVPLRFIVTGTSQVRAALFSDTVPTHPGSAPLAWDNDNSGTSAFGWKPRASGNLYLRVLGYDSSTPSYDVHVEEIVNEDGNTPANATVITSGTMPIRAVDYQEDVDWFTFSVPSNGIYALSFQSNDSISTSLFASSILTDGAASPLASGGGWSGALETLLVGGQSYYVRVGSSFGNLADYTLTLTARGPDDHGNAASASTPLMVGRAYAGSIQSAEDQDWFSLRVTSLDVYEARFSGSALDLMLVGPDGTTVLQSTGYSSSGSLHFSFWDEGPYYFSVRSSDGSNGAFSLVVDCVARDTAANFATLATAVSTGISVPGAIDYERDLDWYSIQLERNRVYEFSIISSSSPGTIKLYAADASAQLGVASAPSSQEAVLLRRAGTSGVHFLQISKADSSSSGSGSTGAYAFQVNDLGWDDHGDAATAATAVTAEAPAAGRVQFGGDVDWFSVPTTANHSYRVTVTPLGFTAQARLVDTNGYWLLGDQSSYLPIVFEFSAVSEAPFFVNVSAAPTNGIGSFTVDVEDLGESP